MFPLSRFVAWARRPQPSSNTRGARRPVFFTEIVISDGDELLDRLLAQGFSPDEVVLKYCWPRYAPPPSAGIRSIPKLENLGKQFDRLVAMHRVVPSRVPMPAAIVKSEQGEFAGYILEYVEGTTLHELISLGMLDEARRQLRLVEQTIGTLHARALPHGDVNASNVLAADDGRTLLIDPVSNPGPGARLQDELCLRQIRHQIDLAATDIG
jgi:hypothetical protein